MTPTKKILIVVTNDDEFEKAGFRTGLWLSELIHFWEVAEDAGYQMDIASPSGGKVPIDPESLIIPEWLMQPVLKAKSPSGTKTGPS